MFRSLALAAVLLAAANTDGAMLSGGTLMPGIRSDAAEPWTTTFELNQDVKDNRLTLAEFTLPTTAENDSWVITEANVGDFGETWENVTAWADGLNNIPLWTHRVVNWTHNGLRDQLVAQDVESRLAMDLWGVHLENFVIDSITLEFFFFDRPAPQTDRAQLRWTIAGDGVLVPEPCSPWLLVLAMGSAPMSRRPIRRTRFR